MSCRAVFIVFKQQVSSNINAVWSKVIFRQKKRVLIFRHKNHSQTIFFFFAFFNVFDRFSAFVHFGRFGCFAASFE